MKLASLIRKCKSKKISHKYDIEVEDNHNYFANGICVHNSVGQDITDNILHVESIPTEINSKENVVVRGEFYIPKTTFLKLTENDNKVSNERNLCAGAINSKNPRDTASKGIRFIGYRVWINGKEEQSLSNTFNVIEGLFGNHFGAQAHLQALPQLTVDRDVRYSIKIIQEMSEVVGYRTDGIVFAIKDLDQRESLGWTENNPKGAVAFKFQTEQVRTRLLNINWEASNYGVLTPVAVFSPVVLCDTVVKEAQLFNAKFIAENNISIGNDIVVEKSGDIIPHVIRGIRTNMGENINFPEYCPECARATKFDGTTVFCINPECPAVLSGTIVNWLTALEISEPGPAMVRAMVDDGMVKNIVDMYSLEEEDVAQLPRCSLMLARRYIKNIQDKKTVTLEQFLNGLPIRGIGKTMWKDVANEFGSLNGVRTANKVKLEEISGIGSITATFIEVSLLKLSWLINELLKHITVEDVFVQEGPLTGMSFAMTGKLSKPRSFYEKTVVNNGGSLKSVSRGLSYLIVGQKPGTKAQKAELLGVKVITEKQFMEMSRANACTKICL